MPDRNGLSAEDFDFEINFQKSGDVYTRYGEFLGKWDTDESDVWYEFTPDGASEVLFSDQYMRSLSDQIQIWLHKKGQGL